ncbi:MAG: ATP-binding protein [Bacteroidetes bacterium]|nr:ATP-binding protein [Bacteroidota bacterium]
MVIEVKESEVPVNFGKLLETQLKKWQGGGHHPRGIAEYISNSSDSYGRLKQFSNQKIEVEIYSRTGKAIDKLIVRDYAEGMSFDDLENKFFKYFESFSGREKGEKVTGRFGTGGKAYAIMNFRDCWINSIKDGKECRAWFKWNYQNKTIVRGYNKGGYRDRETYENNGTTVFLESSLKVSLPLDEFIQHLEKLERNRHILKSHQVSFKIIRKKTTDSVILRYDEPDSDTAVDKWTFKLPPNLINGTDFDNYLHIRFFEKPIGENAFIDLTDGISSVADLVASNYDSRPFSKYINGTLVITKLIDSVAIKENRRGLEEGDDLTIEIESFLKEKINEVINCIEDHQKEKDKLKRINAVNEKLNELSKFLNKQDLKFRVELKEMKRRFNHEDETSSENNTNQTWEGDSQSVFRKPTESDAEELLVKGTWVQPRDDESSVDPKHYDNAEFLPSDDGKDLAVKVGSKSKVPAKKIREKKGLQVLMSNDLKNPDSPTFTEFDDPVSDRDMYSIGVIWINAVHPIIVKYGDGKENEVVRNENIANFVLLIVSQYYAQKEAETQPEDERDDILILFRKHFFKLQLEIRVDREINYFD